MVPLDAFYKRPRDDLCGVSPGIIALDLAPKNGDFLANSPRVTSELKMKKFREMNVCSKSYNQGLLVPGFNEFLLRYLIDDTFDEEPVNNNYLSIK